MDDGRLDDILNRCRRGELAAFDPVVTAWERQMLRWCRSWGVPPGHDAQEIVNDVLLKAYKKWVVERPTVPKAWLLTATYRRCCNWHRKRRRLAQREVVAERVDQPSPDFTHQHAERDEQRNQMKQIELADPQGYSRLYRYAVQDYTLTEIAAQDHVTRSAISHSVASAIQRGKQGDQSAYPGQPPKRRSRKKGGNKE